jgi:hypothetical protein
LSFLISHFSTQFQFQYKRLSEMTVRQPDPTISQSVKNFDSKSGRVKSFPFKTDRLIRPYTIGWSLHHCIHSILGSTACERDCRLAMSTNLRRYHIFRDQTRFAVTNRASAAQQPHTRGGDSEKLSADWEQERLSDQIAFLFLFLFFVFSNAPSSV